MAVPILLLLGGALAVVVAASGGTAERRAPRVRPVLKFTGLSQQQRAVALIDSWKALADAAVKAYGPAQGWLWKKLLQVDGLVWDPMDLWNCTNLPKGGGCVARSLDPDAVIARWNDNPDATYAALEELLRRQIAAVQADQDAHGYGITGNNNEELDMWQLGEAYATEAAIAYLSSSVPGAGAVLAAGEILGGPGWNYGVAIREELSPAEHLEELRAYRRVAYGRLDGLISYLGG